MQKKSLCADDLQGQKTEMIKRYSPMVYRLAYSLVKSSSDADDIHQEVFVRYIVNGPLFASKEHEKAWFIRVTTNLCKNWWRTAWRRKVVSFSQYAEAEADFPVAKGNVGYYSAEGPDVPYGGYGEVQLSEEDDCLITAVKSLPLKYRTVIHLFYYEELSVEEIAGVLELQPSTVRTQLTRARRKLKELLKEEV